MMTDILKLLRANKQDLVSHNKELAQKSPEEIIKWVMIFAQNPVVTTNFRPYEASILHAVTCINPSAQIVWCDTGYNTSQTYKHADQLIKNMDLNISIFLPKQSVAHRNTIMGIPGVEDENHSLFTKQVKLEPFERAMKKHKPDVWFTNLRAGQTSFRDGIGILSFSKDGILKVSPFYHWSDEELDDYLKQNNLPNEFKYFDPTKALTNRECGIHN